MNEKDAWNLFTSTGKVTDYIEYSRLKNSKKEEHNETERKGNSFKI